MTLTLTQSEQAELGDEPFPPEVEFVISALEAGPRPPHERQKQKRIPYRVKAMMRLFSDAEDHRPAVLYTRHVNSQAIGFVTRKPLTLSHGGLMSLPMPDGSIQQIGCTVLRCRQAAPGWYEGAVYFNRPRLEFAGDGSNA